MKKIMFKTQHGLEQAVLEGRKTMTRRVINEKLWIKALTLNGAFQDHRKLTQKWLIEHAPYKIGEMVAIAQAYKDIPIETLIKLRLNSSVDSFLFEKLIKQSKGYTNKMYVASLLMPHHIRITDVKIERLQQISIEDCLREGVEEMENAGYTYRVSKPNGEFFCCCDARMAFGYLIDLVSGKGTWEKNPFVFAYSFQLVS